MRKRHGVSLLLILATGAFLLANDRSHAVEHVSHGQEARRHNEDHAHIAMTDMLRHAADHLAVATPYEHTFGSVPAWTAEWELRWIDVHHEDHLVRIYHATHAHHSNLRYVIIVDPVHHHADGWMRLH